jgi:hypothetical protein
MVVRILHCSDLIENYNVCIDEEVAGFKNRGPQPGDLVYLAVKVEKQSLCGARFVLDEPTDHKPWADADNYVNSMSVKDIEYCEPFDLSVLAGVGGKYWSMKYMQSSKAIKDEEAVRILDQQFQENRREEFHRFDVLSPAEQAEEPETDDETTVADDSNLNEIVKAVPDAKIRIMGTFQTVQFSNETDKLKGLEALVKENFYSLFPQFPESKTLLISENRLFKTKGVKLEGNNVQGIRTIPDGLLIEFDRKLKHPFRVNLIEYECYGERKQRETEKSTYLNTTIIPQLMRFASAFSIITDEHTRVKTVDSWVEKIINNLNDVEDQHAKFAGWVKELSPNIKEHSIERMMEKLLIEAFKTNLRVLLIIDELSAEQKSTIKNVVSSFKLADGASNVQFAGYVVRLVERINILNNDSEFALTIQ